MKVSELIHMLQTMRPDDEVVAYDADAGGFMPVTGCVFGGPDKTAQVELHTDER